MQSIGDGAFEGCSALVKITFKGAANNEAVSLRIGEGAFRSCTLLTEVLFDAKSRVTDLGAEAFKGCVRLTQISLPASLTVIGANAFERTKLASVTFAENGNLTEIGAKRFHKASPRGTQIPRKPPNDRGKRFLSKPIAYLCRICGGRRGSYAR